VVEEAANYIGIAVGNLINILSPQVVMLGGGVIEALEQEVMPTITKAALAHVLPGTTKGLEIMASKLADNAGIAGAAVLARRGTK
jgi:glucokinase